MSTIPVSLSAPSKESAEKGNTVSNSLNNIVGPISSKYCVYFYILSVLAIVFFVIVLGTIMWAFVTKKIKLSYVFISALYSVQFLLIYLQNRLLYNMCINSI